MKKTALITLEYPPMIGGVAHYYARLVQQLPQDKIVVINNSNNQLLSNHRYVWPRWLIALSTVLSTLRREKIEHLLVGQILPLGTVALLCHLITGVPYTVMTHAMDVTLPFGPQGSRRKQLLQKWILRHAHSVTTVSSYTKMQLESLLKVEPRKIHLVYPCPHISGLQLSNDALNTAAEKAAVTSEWYNNAGMRILLSVGRLVERKGVDMVIASLPTIIERMPNVRYVVIGDGEYRDRLEQLAEHYGVSRYVTFLGSVSEEIIAGWMQRAELCIMPSRELQNRDVEGFGIVFVEAGSFGKPVIGGKSGGVLDAIIDGYNGYLVNGEDIAMISSAVLTVLQNPEKARIMGGNGKNRVAEFFQWEIQARKLESLLT